MVLESNKILFDILKNKTTSPPFIANIIVDAKCNLNCEYCRFHSPFNWRKSHLGVTPFSMLKKVISDLDELGLKYVNIGSRGDPWLYPHIIEAIDLIEQKKMKLTISTNLAFKKAQIRNAFGKADTLHINFSCADESLYRKVQGPFDSSSYGHLIENLNYYSALYNKTKKPGLVIVYVITRNNYAFIEKMLDLLRGFSIKHINFKFMEPTRLTKKLLLKTKEALELRRIIKRIKEKTLVIDNNLDLIFRAIEKTGKTGLPIKRCFIPWFNIFINPSGDIALCCKNSKLTIDNVAHASLKTIWFL